jgi:hypothetical protein
MSTPEAAPLLGAVLGFWLTPRVERWWYNRGMRAWNRAWYEGKF